MGLPVAEPDILKIKEKHPKADDPERIRNLLDQFRPDENIYDVAAYEKYIQRCKANLNHVTVNVNIP